MDKKTFIDTIGPYYKEALDAWYRHRGDGVEHVIIMSQNVDHMKVYVVPCHLAAETIRESFTGPTMQKIAERILTRPAENRAWLLLMGENEDALGQIDYRRHIYKRNN